MKAVGTEHRIVAIAHMNLGTLEAVRKNYPKCLEYTDQAQKILEVNPLKG